MILNDNLNPLSEKLILVACLNLTRNILSMLLILPHLTLKSAMYYLFILYYPNIICINKYNIINIIYLDNIELIYINCIYIYIS